MPASRLANTFREVSNLLEAETSGSSASQLKDLHSLAANEFSPSFDMHNVCIKGAAYHVARPCMMGCSCSGRTSRATAS